MSQSAGSKVTLLKPDQPPKNRAKAPPKDDIPPPDSTPQPDAPDPAAEFRAKAQVHALKALERLAWLMEHASSEAVRASAANSVIDRAHGRAAQAVRVAPSGSEDGEGVELRFTWQNPEKS